MGAILKTVGFFWAAIGVYYLYTLFGNTSDPGAIGMGVVATMVVSIIPSLLLMGLGARLDQKAGDQ